MPDDDVTQEQQDGGDDAESAGRPFWSGTLSFGLVSVPVNLYPAVRSASVGLRMLSSEGHPLARRYFCPEEDKTLAADDLVRGYELDDGHYVIVTDDELAALDPKKSRDIDLRLFVPEEELDPVYFVRPFVLASAAESPKAYRLLAAIMEREKRAGIATFVMRDKEYLIAILSRHGVLRAESLRFADELRAVEDLGEKEGEPREDLVKEFAKAIAKRKADKLDERLLADPQRQALHKLIEEKRERGRDVMKAPAGAAAADAEVIDLMEVLRRSLPGAKAREADDGGSNGGATAKAKKKPARAAAKPKKSVKRSSRSARSKAG